MENCNEAPTPIEINEVTKVIIWYFCWWYSLQGDQGLCATSLINYGVGLISWFTRHHTKLLLKGF